MSLLPRSYQAQLLVVAGKEILLGTWLRGSFRGRITAPISAVARPEDATATTPPDDAFAAAAVTATRELAGVDVEVSMVKEVARLSFIEKEINVTGRGLVEELDVERVFLYRAESYLRMQDSPLDDQVFKPAWYGLDCIPYEQMPKGKKGSRDMLCSCALGFQTNDPTNDPCG